MSRVLLLEMQYQESRLLVLGVESRRRDAHRGRRLATHLHLSDGRSLETSSTPPSHNVLAIYLQ